MKPNGTKSLENLPPTVAALTHHVKRALLQAGFYWNQATNVQQHIPDFSMWGCYLDSKRLGNLTGPIFQMLVQPVPFSSVAAARCQVVGRCKYCNAGVLIMWMWRCLHQQWGFRRQHIRTPPPTKQTPDINTNVNIPIFLERLNLCGLLFLCNMGYESITICICIASYTYSTGYYMYQ